MSTLIMTIDSDTETPVTSTLNDKKTQPAAQSKKD